MSIDPAVHLQTAGGVVPLDEGAHLADGVQLVLQKGLAAEAGLHRHDQHHVQPLQVGEHGGGGGDGPQGHRLFHLAGLHPPQGLGDASGVVGLQVDGEEINWIVPPVLDTEAFDIKSQDNSSIRFVKDTRLTNASGTTFDMNIDRTVSLMDAGEVAADFNIQLTNDMKIVAYKSENKITNTGDKAWTKEGGLVSVWMLGCFNPTPTTTVFIPYKQDAEGTIVNDEYFGKIPADRLIKENGIIYFKIDGLYRSKLGLPASRATDICGSYDSSKGVLTILWCSLPETPSVYVNGQWGPQEDPFAGDVINSYNDGPVEDGSIMGPFYEIETSSPGAELAPGASLVHTQKVIHVQGKDEQLVPIVQDLFGADLNVIKTKFQ